ncbi:MAG: EAL domain-containing protein [Acidimicrobiales bacterium]
MSQTDGNELIDDDDATSGLDQLITELATTLMGVGVNEAQKATDEALARLRGFFEVTHVFLRRNDLERRVSVLVGDEPPREVIPDPDPLYEVPFDSDPVFAASEHMKETMIVYPEESDELDKRLEAASGQAQVTVASVPLIRGVDTVGVLGLVHYGMRRWSTREIRCLTAIATLFAQLWGRLEAEAEVVHQAYYDGLTGLPNRRRLTDLIDAVPDDRRVSLLVLDIDNMKVINDGLDFEAGNLFIRSVGERLTQKVRATDVVARLQGDQFAVLITDLDPAVVDVIARRLATELAVAVDVADLSIARSVSIGVAHNAVSESNQELMNEADAALHEAKARGKKRAVTFDTTMRSRVLQRFEMELELRRALDNDEFVLHYQPEVDLNTGEIVATEALLRWHHPERGLLSAGVFIETAEQSGLVVEIGDFVLEQAIKQIALWQHDHPNLEMWINISPAQLMSRDLVSQVGGLLNTHGVDAHRICLEVTEHSVLDDIEFTRGSLETLRNSGVKLALDDFGTGYSSMKQLKNLPITTLKIDMTFVAGLGVSEYDSAIVDAAITLADAFGLKTVAEGIEKPEQIGELLRRGCHVGQGFYMARPAAPEDIELLLHQPLSFEGAGRRSPAPS